MHQNSSLRTDAELAVGNHRRPGVLAEVVVEMWTATDWKDEVVTVGVVEFPVLTVVCVHQPLEGESQHAGLVAKRRIHDVVPRISNWLLVPTSRPSAPVNFT